MNYSKIYIFYEGNLEGLSDIISSSLQLQRTGVSEFKTHGIYIYISQNDDYSRQASKIFPNGFLRFPYFIEIEGGDDKLHIDFLTNILELFWNSSLAAVAASDFEEALPKSGGYNNLNVPWPRNGSVP